MTRAILHVDMDAFFASVEQRDRPELRGQPVLVGRVHRGVVCAASYEARPSGARSAMPMVEALRRCPNAVVVPPRFSAYQAASHEVFAIFRRYTPLVEGLSLDEAFLDVTGSLQLFGAAADIAARVRQDIATELNLPASAGVAPCKFVAKLASDHRKPRGLFVVAPEEVRRFLAPLPVERMLGVGPKQAAALHRVGLSTMGALQAADPDALARHLGRAGAHLQAMARGIDPRPVVADAAAKSIGAEATLDADVADLEALRQALLGHALAVAGRLHRAGACAGSVQVKLKDRTFRLQTRQVQLSPPSRDPDVLYAAASDLLARFAPTGRSFRLVGLTAQDLHRGAVPKALFVPPQHTERAALEDVRMAVARRFGQGKLTRASLLAGGPRAGGGSEGVD